MDRSPQIFQIVGFQNSGKTTVIQEFIRYCTHHNLTVGTIKHHGHGGTPSTTNDLKDTDKHRIAGSMLTAVEGNGALLLQNRDLKWTIQDILKIYELLPLDLILLEGYKYEPYPKAVIIRNKEDTKLLSKLNNIQAVLTWIPLENFQLYPVFPIKEYKIFHEWLFEFLSNKRLDKK
ncbi:molybdopterin-guanine dinucleotide biosynthesis protein B [Heyndrickxia vini]|uniref:Molybdopterin-guanine dinucleotide biosynthesis protein B n=1 Tax=Heyndrickxia vini TaxID=1476025 RepID=A0ABX7E624_9BACI|nr:molybdopterin-guanine dinucleotide biosynthesis protein B [Heyndrickxia vini]QQZ11168.1 molybdopterin-guanine dinucleotide biosynthesis protein B [Heyndrickxia vini]